MFLGKTLLSVAAISNFLSTVIPPGPVHPSNVFNRPIREFYDYIVVGAGSAGGIVATRLSEGHDSVLLLEAGGAELENNFTTIPLMWFALEKSELDWNFKIVPQKYSFFAMEDQFGSWPRGKCLGGSGRINAMAYVRGNRNDYDSWQKEGASGWGYDNVLPFFKKIENVNNHFFENSKHSNREAEYSDLVSKATREEVYEGDKCKPKPDEGEPEYIPDIMPGMTVYVLDIYGKSGLLSIVTTRMTTLEFLHIKAAEEVGLFYLDCNCESQIGFCNVHANIRNGERCDTSSCYLKPALNKSNLQVNLHIHVSKILIDDNGKAYGVEYIQNGKRKEVFVRKEVILSAGVVGSPHILLLSGIGPKQHLTDKNIPVKADLPVGDHVQDHVSMYFHYSINVSLNSNFQKMIQPDTVLEYVLYRQGIYSQVGADGMLFVDLNTTDDNRAPEIQMIMLGIAYEREGIEQNTINHKEEVVKEYVKRATPQSFQILINMLRTKSKGNIKLSTDNPADPPQIDPRYLSHPDDVDIFVKGIRFLQKLENTNAWKSIGATMIPRDTPGHCDNIAYNTDDYWQCIVRHFAHQGNHQTSSCRMGASKDPKTVVDSRLRVKGIKNLRVIDSSVMPVVPSGNTNAPTMMIAEKGAHMILEDNK